MRHIVPARLFRLAFFVMLVLGGITVMAPNASAEGEAFNCSGIVTNGLFESPEISSDAVVTADGWNESIFLTLLSASPFGVQTLFLWEDYPSASQNLATTGLVAGDTITISFWYDTPTYVALGTEAYTTAWVDGGGFGNATISYTLALDEEPVTLAFSKTDYSPYIDGVSATCTHAAPVVAADQPISVPYEGSFDGTLTATGGLDAYTFAEGTAPTKGDVTIESDGSFTYTANPGQSGTDSFTFSATDPLVPDLTDIGTVTVTIATPAALTTLPLALTADAGETVGGDLSSQVSGGDPPYTFLPASVVGLSGVFQVAADGTFDYSAFPYASGTDTLTYTVIDDQATPATTTGTVTFTITAADAVVADDESVDVPYEGAVGYTLTATGGFGSYTFAEETAPTKGTVAIEPDGSFLYTANPGQSGSDSFTFTATDTLVPALTDTGTVTVTIAAPETLSTLPLSLTVDAGETVSGNLIDQVTGGGPPYGFTNLTGPGQGALTFDSFGPFSFTADPDASGTVTFTYSVSDDQATPATTTGTVTITITAADAVVADDQSIDVAYESSIDNTLTATGGFGTYSFTEGTSPTKGIVSIDPDGSFTYTANSGQSGSDSFSFIATDTVLPALTDTGTVTVTIAAPDPLTTAPLSLTVNAGETLTGNLIDQVTGGDPPYAFALDTNPGQGTVTIDPDGSFSYTADLAGSGSDSFSYTVSDDQGTSATATGTVSITIVATPIPDTTVQITGDPRFAITGSAAIPAEVGLIYTLETAPGIGTVVVDADGSFTYTIPATMATGDSFTVLATAPDGETAVVTVVVTFEIDPTVSTSGTVKPGGTATGGGGSPNDARDGVPSQPQPTSVPSDESDDDDGRVELP